MKKILVFGYGNPGRLDDGLGPAFAAKLEEMSLDGVTVDSNYQLTVEDADQIKDYDVVFFVDASVDCKEPFELSDVTPESTMHFSSHFFTAGDVLGLAQELFQAKTKAHVLAIRGYEFNEFGEWLSEKAQNNLEKAVEFFREKSNNL
jgi:hydrogenase maturation protease